MGPLAHRLVGYSGSNYGLRAGVGRGLGVGVFLGLGAGVTVGDGVGIGVAPSIYLIVVQSELSRCNLGLAPVT